jgi:hypothetical protein
MTTTVISALYEDLATAQRATQDLVDSGFNPPSISIVASDTAGEYRRYIGDEEQPGKEMADDNVAVGAGIGAAVGSIGGLLVGLGSLFIPGIGPIIAAGPLLTTLAGAGVGAGVGAIAGGLVGALVDMGVPEEEANYYAEGVRRGGALVTIQVDDEWTNQIRTILERHNPIDIGEHASQWQQEGWSHFDSDAALYTASNTPYQAQAGAEAYAPTGEDEDFDDYDLYNARFRQHYESNYANGPYTYDNYASAYRYGLDLANYNYYSSRHGWAEVEPEVRRSWEERNPGTWKQFQDAIRYAWDEVTNVLGSDDAYETYRSNFYHHYNENYAQSGYLYDHYERAYRYGYHLSYDPRLGNRTWAEVEPEARHYWEEQAEGPWDQFKDAVRHAWEEVKMAVGVR